ncbi:MAG: extracellular solute-binding protein [Geminicoccaceae bacterium]
MSALYRAALSFAVALPLVSTAFVPASWAEDAIAPVHGIAMHGDLKYPTDFEHFDYANPDAPKGGTLSLSASGSFDSFNPYILKGTPAAGTTLLFETLMTGSLDEPFSYYGLLAETIETPEDRSWVIFGLDPDARWHDGEPVTPEDVVFSFEALTTKGHPQYRAYYASVTGAEKLDDHRVKFTFDGNVNRELPLIMGQLPILPKHYYETVPFDQTSLKPPLGSGSYKIKSFEAGRTVVYERVEDYWGKDLPVNRGHNNFDEVRYEYYRDREVAFEAFKAGEFDLWAENSAKRWATGFTGPQFDSGRIIAEKLAITPPARMQGFIFNTRREKFKDRKVREAIGNAFDFEWSNKTLMYGQYERISSYFHGDSSLASSGLPEGEELALLEPFRDQLPEEVFTTVYAPPKTDGAGNNRKNLRTALNLLKEAGWVVQDGQLTNQETGEKMVFELLFYDPSSERLAAPFVKNLEKLGIKASIRIVDPAQYQNRMDDFDFDMTTDLWAQSDSPGNEQRDYWGSETADRPGSRNSVGIKDPVVDALIDKIIQAPTREALEIASKALDRVLLWGHYEVPHFTDNGYRTGYWNKFGMPEVLPTKSPDFFSWWIDEEKLVALEANDRGGARAEPSQ